MQSYSYDPSMISYYQEKKPPNIHPEMNQINSYQNNIAAIKTEPSVQLSKSQLAHLRESPEARSRRLKRNAERMREKRAKESYEEYRIRLEKNALANRIRRQRENNNDKAIRQVRDAARQRLKRAMETPEERALRLEKLAERMRTVRQTETPDKKAERLAKSAQRARERLLRETSEERRIRLAKGSEYARRVRSSKSKSSSMSDISDTTLSDSIDQKPISTKTESIGSAENSMLNHSFENHQQITYQQPQIYHQQQQVITIPTVSRNGAINLHQQQQTPRLPQNHQYLSSMQLSIPPNYSYPSAVNSNYTMPPVDMNNINFLIHQQNHAAINIPQYHTMLSTQGVHQKETLHKPKAVPNSVIQQVPSSSSSFANFSEHKSRGRPRKATETSELPKMEFVLDNNVKVSVMDDKKSRNRPYETEQQRAERLRKTAEASRIRRKNETEEQRARRLYDLKVK